ncbi:MAG: 1,2-dihydroxy-3-keto-5-methylthiopentene dioxygenase [Flavobacteriales bacterium]|jgi:1,2-dihydroxy-3-keto-5-methylthiopentene dioxygenase
MSELKIFVDSISSKVERVVSNIEDIRRILGQLGIGYEQWTYYDDLPRDCDESTVLSRYEDEVDRLMTRQNYKRVDVLSLNSDNSDKESLREKFLPEHRHSEDEVRFFVRGGGLFALHIEGKVYEVMCKAGDLLSIPANTAHWFDMGASPEFTVIRFFNNPDGWVAQFTDSAISERFSRLG